MLVGAFTAAGVTAVYLRRFCAETFRRATRPWAGGAAFAAVSTALASARGLWKSSAWDVGRPADYAGIRTTSTSTSAPTGSRASSRCSATSATPRTLTAVRDRRRDRAAERREPPRGA